MKMIQDESVLGHVNHATPFFFLRTINVAIDDDTVHFVGCLVHPVGVQLDDG